jgi:signal transduction histidine kinase
MSNSPRSWFAAAVLVAVAGAGMVFLVLGSAGTHSPGSFASRGRYLVYLLLIGWGFAGSGLYAWSRRPGNRVGPLLTATGGAWLLRGLEVSGEPLVFAVGKVAAPWAFAVLTHLLLAFPSGRLGSWRLRLLAGIAYLNVTALQLAELLFTDTQAPGAECPGCPPNPVLVTGPPAIGAAIGAAQGLLALLVLVGLVIVLARRWWAATTAQRRTLTPVLVTGAVTVALITVTVRGVAPGAANVLTVLTLTCFAFVPFAFLVGLLRSRLGEAEAVTMVVRRLGASTGRSAVRDALAEALGDPQLQLAYWVPEIASYADSTGHRINLPGPDDTTSASLISHEGEPLAAVIHVVSLAEQETLVPTIGAAVELALRNERLDAALRARVEELRASRARIVEAGDEQRRRIERDLHDGAQQRLMALGIDLRLARERVACDPGGSEDLLDAALHELGEATAELRELARGIHPSILTNRGLPAALQALAGRSPVPVVVTTSQHRFPAPIESAVYFLVSEALTNAARYACAQQVTVTVSDRAGLVEVEVHDDGVGGADPVRGSGLRGLHDRIAALDGRLEVASVGGQGTTLRVELPCA